LPYRAMRSALGDEVTEARIRSAFAEHVSQSMAPLGVSGRSIRDAPFVHHYGCNAISR
jgi:hypothetical protein